MGTIVIDKFFTVDVESGAVIRGYIKAIIARLWHINYRFEYVGERVPWLAVSYDQAKVWILSALLRLSLVNCRGISVGGMWSHVSRTDSIF